MSEEQEQMDYEAHNAKTALDLNKARRRIAELEADLKQAGQWLSESGASNQKLMAENKRLREIINTRIPGQGRQIKRLRDALKRHGWEVLVETDDE